jgi:hypothetical protein
MAKVSGLLTCKDTSVILSGSSSTQGVTYQWKGAKGYNATEQKISVTFPGLFLLTVTNPANGCKSLAEAEVMQNVVPPAGITASAAGIMTCKSPLVRLTGTSVTPGVTYSWTGPDFTSSVSNPAIAVPGKYTLTVTNPINGCSSIAHAIAEQNIKEPEVTVFTPDTLTCKNHKVLMKVVSNKNGMDFKWSGPGGFESSVPTTTTSSPGNYAVIVTDPANGCLTNKTLIVMLDTTWTDVDISVSGILNCKVKSVKIDSKPSISKVSYKWSGPDNFSSELDNPMVANPGTYNVTLTKATTGCTTKKSIKVTADIAVPEKVFASVSGNISCAMPRVKLAGTSITNGVMYAWSGPQGFKSEEKNPGIILPGNYSLDVINPQNGCVSKVKVTVLGEKCSK